ncbi:MAG: TonB family protein [Bacteroidetes bacterium]|jgi:protein TonB|nr:TonB family protein [Bacteroidota bacterium]
MSIAKLDLYNPEWLELVFDDKNKDYGAYDLRRHYAGTMAKSMAIAFLSMAVLYTGYTVLKPKAPAVEPTIIRDYTIKPPPMIKDEHVIPPTPATSRPPAQQATIQYTAMRPVDDREATNPPTLIELDSKPIGSATKSGTDEGVNIDIPDQGNGTVATVITEEKPKEMYEIQVLPEPYGGAEAWAKFLQKNIHYPPQAAENNVHGKVFLSFIVETDGHLSNIKVERGVGSGLDEEALRVLRIAPAWKPGIQNGHKVRVMYNIPINFVLPDQE